MHRFLLGHNDAPDWRTSVHQCLEQLGPVPPDANLGFLYLSDHHGADAEAIVELLRLQTGVSHWTGTVGMGVIATGTEYYDGPALSILIGAFEPDSFRCFHSGGRDLKPLTEGEAEWLSGSSQHFAVVHGDPRNMAVPLMIEAMGSEIPGGFSVGGLASSNTDHFPLIAGTVASAGLSGVVFNESTQVSTALTQGCSPISAPVEVTESLKNILVTLGGRPALEVMKEAMGEMLARDLNKAAGYIFAGLPVEGSDTGDYMVRNLVGVDPDNGLVAIGETIETGRNVMFCRRDGQTAQDDLLRMIQDIRKRAGERPIRGGLYFSCLGRGRHMFGEASRELGIIQQELGDVPIAGFFANGEISHSRLYGFTGVLTLFH
ncbi:MAG: FIST signal transduction protein [Gammaproteobacteria bacterium]